MQRPLELHRSFIKSYRKRVANNTKLAAQYKARVEMFLDGIRETPLNDHPLVGTKAGQRAFSITSDVRVVYIETETAIIFLDIGTHNQVYGG